jgi:hypothetical protein
MGWRRHVLPIVVLVGCGGGRKAAPPPENAAQGGAIAVQLVTTGPQADVARAEFERALATDAAFVLGEGGRVVRVVVDADDSGCSLSATIDGGEEFGQGVGSAGGMDPANCVQEIAAEFANDLLAKLHE